MDLELLPPDVQQLLQLFAALPDVRFPDLDVFAMQEAVARLNDRRLELAHIEAQLAMAQSAVDEENEALLKKSHRLLSYLKVFAEHDEALLEKVNALSLPRLKKTATAPRPAVEAVDGEATESLVPAPRKRGRPRKVQANVTMFTEAEPVGAPA